MTSYLIKELGQVITGNTPSKNRPEFYKSKDIRFVKPDIISDSQITNIEYTNEYISEEARVKARIVKTGSVFVTCIGSIGKVGIVEDGEYAFNQQINAIVPNEKVLPRYLAYCLLYNKNRLLNIANAPVVPIINKTQFENFSINITKELFEQQKVIDALDKVSNLILLRQHQLKELDNCVKSHFIEMFGEPVLNPRGWKKDALSANVALLNGRAYKQDELLDSGKYPVLRVGNFFSNRGWYYSDLELEEDRYCDNGDLLYAWSASFGPQIWNGGKVIYHYHIWKVLVGNAYNKHFLCKLLDYTTENLMRNTHGVAMMHLTKSGMEETIFIVPPLELQEQFATFVEQIDKLKSLVKQSLDETQLLFMRLMQKYFG